MLHQLPEYVKMKESLDNPGWWRRTFGTPSHFGMKANFICCQRRLLAQKSLEDELHYHINVVPFALTGVRLYRMFVTGFYVPKTFKDPLTRSERIRLENLLVNSVN